MQLRNARRLTSDMANFWRLEGDPHLHTTGSTLGAPTDHYSSRNQQERDSTYPNQTATVDAQTHMSVDCIEAVAADNADRLSQQLKMPGPAKADPIRRNPWTITHSFFLR